MKLLLDMNLSPSWVRFLEESGLEAVHWSTVGSPAATDARGPSVVLLRTQDVLPDAVGSAVVRSLREHSGALDQGAVMSIDANAARVRLLPMR